MIHVIINPTAGNGYAKEVGERVVNALAERGIPHVRKLTDHAGHATELARASVAEGADTVLSVGGDGTAFEVASGLVGTRAALGLIPAGTGNDFIKTIGTPRQPMEALDFVLSHDARQLDIGRLNDGFFLNVCGTGFDVMVLDYTEKAKKHMRGILPYLYGVVRTVANFRAFPMEITLDAGEKLSGSFTLCTVANGRYIGGGIPIAPEADVADGLLEVMVLDAVPRWRVPFYLPGLLMGRILRFKITHRYRCREVVLKADSFRLNVDGERWPMREARFACEKGALRVHW